MEYKKLFSKSDAIAILEMIHRASSCINEDEFRELMNRLRSLIAFEYACCGIFKIEAPGLIGPGIAVNINCPSEAVELYNARKEYLIDPIASKAFTEFGLQYWGDTIKELIIKGYKHPTDYRDIMIDFGLIDGYTYSVRNFKKPEGSSFAFSGRKMKRDKRAEAVFELVAPHLHEALARIGNLNANPDRDVRLSPREHEVLKWLKQGKTTWEISIILCISERTVKFHISNIMHKLDATTRAHAIAVAIERGLIDVE